MKMGSELLARESIAEERGRYLAAETAHLGRVATQEGGNRWRLDSVPGELGDKGSHRLRAAAFFEDVLAGMAAELEQLAQNVGNAGTPATHGRIEELVDLCEVARPRCVAPRGLWGTGAAPCAFEPLLVLRAAEVIGTDCGLDTRERVRHLSAVRDRLQRGEINRRKHGESRLKRTCASVALLICQALRGPRSSRSARGAPSRAA